ncbi:hypothetical protein AN477_05720 [Alicyclobacillus ferrooxydans]|uniref:Cytochrome c biogenesis protein CcdC n=2 Tax=Alicyclobacillus ferrooxydans TaxID=471514 RepID=A0A0P9GU69_9BACL|nr:hypothetical protein AN477_05720 [Alicyclobacillus ferrooxydans]
MALIVIVVRLKASQKPTNARKILIPPLGMSTGFLMFVAPQTHMPWHYAVLAFLVGCLFAYPLIASSRMFVDGNDVYLKRSPAFILVLLGLLVLRIVLHTYVEQYVTIVQTGAIFFILAFGMLLPWRIAMFMEYRKLSRQRDLSLAGSLQESKG